MKSSSSEKTLNILLYLKKSDGNWKNTREIATYSNKVTLHRTRLEDDLDELRASNMV